MIIDTNYSQDLLREYGWSAIPFVVAKLLGRLILPIHGFEYWKSHTHYLLWLFRAYKIAGVLLRKPSR